MTFKGTNTYIVGDAELAIIDPGPISDVHFANIIKVIANRPVKFIFLTHSHIDHSPLAKADFQRIRCRNLRFWSFWIRIERNNA